MTEAVEVAIDIALLTRAQAFATANSLQISLPNVEFTPPTVSKTAKYLRATLLPAETATIGVAFSSTDQFLGIMQIDVFYGSGGGEREARRIASDIVEYFARGTRMTSNGFNVEVLKRPVLGPTIKSDAWISLPVRIPYTCFATPA